MDDRMGEGGASLSDFASADGPFGAFIRWHQLEDGLRMRNRFFPKEVEYLESFVSVALDSAVSLAKGEKYYRARIMGAGFRDHEGPFPPEKMGAPDRERARGGRLNPDGIPYLYLADSKETAVAEVRPWVGARISLADFTLGRDARIADLRSSSNHQQADQFDLRQLTHVLSQPAHTEDRHAYLATQFIGERLKSEGLDGISYGSSLHRRGWNLALFDPTLASAGGTDLRKVDSVLYSSSVVDWEAYRQELRSQFGFPED